MKLRHYLFAAALAVTATQAQAQGFSDTSMGVRDSAFVANPGGGKGSRDVNKVIVNVGHFDVWDYGSNFFNVDVLFSDANEPAANRAVWPRVIEVPDCWDIWRHRRRRRVHIRGDSGR